MDNKIGLSTGINIGSGGLTGATVLDTINNISNFQEQTNKSYDVKKTSDLENSAKTMYECSVRTSDGTTKNINISGANSAFMELIIKQAAQASGSTAYDNLGEGEILCRYLNKNPNQLYNTNLVLKGQMTVPIWAKKNGLTVPQVEYIPPEPVYDESNIGKRFKTAGKRGLGTAISAEGLGRAGIGLGDYLENKTRDKITPEDASRDIRYTKYEEAPNKLRAALDEVNQQIAEQEKLLDTQYGSQAEQNIRELNAKKSSIEETIKSLEDTKTNLPTNKPQTVRDTAKEMRLVGNDLKAAGQAATDSTVYYTTEIAPYFKLSNSKFNVQDILKSITKDDFKVSEGMWKEIQKLLNKEIKAYSKSTNVSLEELHKIGDDFRLSSQRLNNGENARALQQQLYDEIHTKIRNIVTKTLEEENPGRGLTDKIYKYSNMRSIEGQAKDYAVSGGKRTAGQGIKSDIKNATTKNPGVQRTIGRGLKIGGKYIKPSTYIMKVVDWFKSNPEKVDKIVKNTEENVLKNAKDFKQPKLFGDSANIGAIVIADMLDKAGVEMPIEIIADIAAYAFETYKLNKENGTDLPLFDKENSYVNQNPNAGNNPVKQIIDSRAAASNIKDLEWYKQLLEYEKDLDEKYEDRIDDVDIEKILNSLE